MYRNQLASNADLAKRFGLGIEMECFDIFNESPTVTPSGSIWQTARDVSGIRTSAFTWAPTR